MSKISLLLLAAGWKKTTNKEGRKKETSSNELNVPRLVGSVGSRREFFVAAAVGNVSGVRLQCVSAGQSSRRFPVQLF